MAKKILYKIKAYHCPKCGGITDPAKKYCEYCGRDISLRTENKQKQMRLLIDSGNYVFWDELWDVHFSDAQTLDCTTLEDETRHMIYTPPRLEFSIKLPMTSRGWELRSLNYRNKHKVRFEMSNADMAFETECFIYDMNYKMGDKDYGVCNINFEGIGDMQLFNSSIPIDVLEEMRCPNCGAPINNRLGACIYCSGWSEVEWA